MAEVRATKQDGDAKNDLFFVTVALDESHFLQTEYGGSYDNVKATIVSTFVLVDLYYLVSTFLNVV